RCKDRRGPAPINGIHLALRPIGNEQFTVSAKPNTRGIQYRLWEFVEESVGLKPKECHRKLLSARTRTRQNDRIIRRIDGRIRDHVHFLGDHSANDYRSRFTYIRTTSQR